MDEFNDAELQVIAAARRRKFRDLSDTEKLLVRKYWRAAKRHSRDGKPGGDRRMNAKFRAWLQKNGYAQKFSAKMYYRWLRETGGE